MTTYVISDIHGQYDMFMELLEKIPLKDSDTLYILGDVVDRGPHPIKTLQKLKEMPNVICMVGNHELMALRCLKLLMTADAQSVFGLDEEDRKDLWMWQYNGGLSTFEEFRELDAEEQQEIIEFMSDFLVYEEVSAGGRDYLLVHAGLGNYSPKKEIEDYSLEELMWMRADYNVRYFDDVIVVTGHTPTQQIKDNPNPGVIYKKNNHIVIDCGAHYPGGRLAAICLDTGEEYYSSPHS
mgnify:FL=1